MNLSRELGQAVLNISAWSHAIAVVSIIGSVANSITSSGVQPLLTAAFGDEKGAAIAIVAISVSAACSQILAHSEPIGSGQEPITSVSQSTTVTSPVTSTKESS